jgi:hypothetical protein
MLIAAFAQVSVGEGLMMGLIIGLAALMTVLGLAKVKVPDWLGFLLIIIGGIAGIVYGGATKNYRDIPIGAALLVAALTLWIDGGTSRPEATSDNSIGATVNSAHWYGGLIAVGALVIGGVLAGVLPQ